MEGSSVGVREDDGDSAPTYRIDHAVTRAANGTRIINGFDRIQSALMLQLWSHTKRGEFATLEQIVMELVSNRLLGETEAKEAAKSLEDGGCVNTSHAWGRHHQSVNYSILRADLEITANKILSGDGESTPSISEATPRRPARVRVEAPTEAVVDEIPLVRGRPYEEFGDRVDEVTEFDPVVEAHAVEKPRKVSFSRLGEVIRSENATKSKSSKKIRTVETVVTKEMVLADYQQVPKSSELTKPSHNALTKVRTMETTSEENTTGGMKRKRKGSGPVGITPEQFWNAYSSSDSINEMAKALGCSTPNIYRKFRKTEVSGKWKNADEREAIAKKHISELQSAQVDVSEKKTSKTEKQQNQRESASRIKSRRVQKKEIATELEHWPTLEDNVNDSAIEESLKVIDHEMTAVAKAAKEIDAPKVAEWFTKQNSRMHKFIRKAGEARANVLEQQGQKAAQRVDEAISALREELRGVPLKLAVEKIEELSKLCRTGVKSKSRSA